MDCPQMTDEQKIQSFFGLLDQLQTNSCRLDEEFELLATEITRKKGNWKMPSIGELKNHFGSFMNQKQSTLRTYWSKHHVPIFLFLLAYFRRRFDLLPPLFEDKHWQALSNLLPGESPESLKYKWFSLTIQTNSTPIQNSWSLKEDSLLAELVETYFPHLLERNQSQRKVKWALLAMKLNHMSGHGLKLAKHCKERWLNHLSPFLNKGDWTEEEDIQLMDHAIALRRKWTKVAEKFPGRTQHQVKNRFLSLVARENSITTKEVDLKGKHDDAKVLKAVCGLKKRFTKRKKPAKANEMWDAELQENKVISLVPFDFGPSETEYNKSALIHLEKNENLGGKAFDSPFFEESFKENEDFLPPLNREGIASDSFERNLFQADEKISGNFRGISFQLEEEIIDQNKEFKENYDFLEDFFSLKETEMNFDGKGTKESSHEYQEGNGCLWNIMEESPKEFKGILEGCEMNFENQNIS